MSGFRALLLLFALVFLTSCDPISEIRHFFGWSSNEDGDSEKAALELPQGKKQGTLAKENQELLAEMIRVVFNRDDSDDQVDFQPLSHALNEGASLEGIYRGIVMGSRYRTLEEKGQGASPTELKVFAIELAEIQDLMKSPTHFDPELAKKPPAIEYPEEVSDMAPPVAVPSNDQTVTKKIDKKERIQELLRTFIGASSFTLKRVLGEEALRKFDESKGDSGEIAQWYAGLAVRLSDKNVDFGLELRKRPDFDFHFKFAQTMAMDRLKWEVLNRYHRYLNAAAKF